jgi:hypothetical protein
MTDDSTVIILGHLPIFELNGAALAMGATALAAGKELVAVNRSEHQIAHSQGLVAPHLVVDGAERLPYLLAVHQGIDTADGVGTGHLRPD